MSWLELIPVMSSMPMLTPNSTNGSKLKKEGKSVEQLN